MSIMNKNKLTNKFWDIISGAIILLFCIVAVGIIPGLIWLIVGVLAEILVKIDKVVTQLNQAFFKLGWGVWVIDIILGIFLYIYLRKRNKEKKWHT